MQFTPDSGKAKILGYFPEFKIAKDCSALAENIEDWTEGKQGTLSIIDPQGLFVYQRIFNYPHHLPETWWANPAIKPYIKQILEMGFEPEILSSCIIRESDAGEISISHSKTDYAESVFVEIGDESETFQLSHDDPRGGYTPEIVDWDSIIEYLQNLV